MALETSASLTSAPQRSLGIALALGFVAGAVSVLTFLEGSVALLSAVGGLHANLYSLRPVPPLGVPQIASSAFWGGAWGMVFAAIAQRPLRGARYWLAGIVLGAVALPMVGWFLVAPLKGQPLAAGWNVSRMGLSMLINGMWGLGTAVIYRVLRQNR